MIYLDTHVVVWLYIKDLKKLSPKVKKIINDNQIYISPMVKVELDYLHYIKRINSPAKKVLQYLNQSIGLTICDKSFVEIIESAENYPNIRDPFDRIIVAHAGVKDDDLITKDKMIRKHYPNSVW